MKKARYKASEGAKLLRKKARSRRKGLQDKDQQAEGVVYAAGAFDAPSVLGPSIQLGPAGAGRGRGKAGVRRKAGDGDSGSSDFDESEYYSTSESSDYDDPGPAKRVHVCVFINIFDYVML